MRIKKAAEMGLHQKEPIFLGLWVAWLLTGSFFYGYAPDFKLGFIKGFYMAINIGYSIGFGHPIDVNTASVWFSTIYVLVGSSFVGVALGFFAEKITEDSESWFSRLQDQKKIEDFILMGNETWKGKLKSWLFHNRSLVRAVSLWLSLVGVLIVMSMYGIGWSFREAQYFAFTTLSTGGHWMIPEDSEPWIYLVTGMVTMVGVPVMGLAMASIGQAMMDPGDLVDAKAAIDSSVTRDELQLLEDLGLEAGNGRLDMGEFIFLNMVRAGTDPGLLEYIRHRFRELSKNRGYITIEDMTEESCVVVDGKLRLRASLPKGEEGIVEELRPEKEAAENHTETVKEGTGEENDEESAGSDIEDGQQVFRINSAPTEDVDNLPLQPEPYNGPPRPLRRGDDMGMALLDRSYVMSLKEEKNLLKEARRRMKRVVEYAGDDKGWSSRGRLAGVKIASKEGVNGSPCNVFKGIAEGDCTPEMQDTDYIEFIASQMKYCCSNSDFMNTMYTSLDVMLIQAGVATRIRKRHLLDAASREELVIAWGALEAPIVANRDFCVVVHSRLMNCPKTGEKIHVYHMFSILHPTVPSMEKALRRIRADLLFLGYIVRPVSGDNTRFSVTYVAQYDPNGSLPTSVINTVALTQGLNAGRLRDYWLKMHSIAFGLDKAVSPVGEYILNRLGKDEHDFQLSSRGIVAAESATESLRTLKVHVNIYAQRTAFVKLCLEDSNGIPLPFALKRVNRSDRPAKNLANGKGVMFGGKGNHYLSAAFYLTVEGPIPKVLRLKFRNGHWRQNRIALPGITSLIECSTPEHSTNDSSFNSSLHANSDDVDDW